MELVQAVKTELSLGDRADYDWQFAGLGVIRDRESNVHGRNENVRIEDLEVITEILRQFLLTP